MVNGGLTEAAVRAGLAPVSLRACPSRHAAPRKRAFARDHFRRTACDFGKVDHRNALNPGAVYPAESAADLKRQHIRRNDPRATGVAVPWLDC